MHTIDTHEFIESVLKAKNEKQKIEIIAKTIDESQKNSIKHLATKGDIKDVKIFVLANTITTIAVMTGIMALFFTVFK